MTSYFVSSVLWTIAGLVVGYALGSAGNQQHFVPRETPVARSRTDAVVGILLIILAVVSVATMAVSLNNQERVVECQATFNEAFTNALRERTEAANRERSASVSERAAMRELLDVLLNPDSDRATRQAAVEKYRGVLVKVDETLGEADASRSQNPLPDKPRCE